MIQGMPLSGIVMEVLVNDTYMKPSIFRLFLPISFLSLLSDFTTEVELLVYTFLNKSTEWEDTYVQINNDSNILNVS